MTPRRTFSAIQPRRRHGVLLLVAALAFNLLFGAWHQPAALAGESLAAPDGAIAICSAEGGIRYVMPDGSAPPTQHSGHDHPGSPCCFTCLATCGIGCAGPAGLAVLLLPDALASASTAWIVALSDGFAPRPFPARPLGRAPPLNHA